MNKTVLLASLLAIAVSAPALAADKESYESTTKVEADSKGNVDAKTKVEATDANGTTSTAEKKVDIDAKSDGTVDKTVTTESTKDPKGLFNKTKVKTKDEVKTDKDGVAKTEHKKVVNGKTVEDTKTNQ